MQDLATRVQGLSPELYDVIFDNVFTSPLDQGELLISKSYHLPAQLQVTRASREQFAHTYYANTTFVFSTTDHLLSWLSSLPESHSSSLRNVILIKEVIMWTDQLGDKATEVQIKGAQAHAYMARLNKQRELDEGLMRKGWLVDHEVFRVETRRPKNPFNQMLFLT